MYGISNNLSACWWTSYLQQLCAAFAGCQTCLCRTAIVRQQFRELHSSVTHLVAGLVEACPAVSAMAPAAYLLDNLQHSLKAGLPQGIMPFGGKAAGQSGELVSWHVQLAQHTGYDMNAFRPVCSCS